MSENFKKLKTKSLYKALAVSALIGVSAGLVSVGIILLSLKLCAISLNAGYYVLIGFAAAAGCFGLTFLLLKPNDKKLAKKLDAEYGLRESVQTMVEYKGEEGGLIEMQRLAADKKLSSLPKSKPRLSKIWHLVLIPVAAVSVFITSVALPRDTVEGWTKPYDPNSEIYTPAESQKTALDELIKTVEESDLKEGIKGVITTALKALRTNMDTDITVGEMSAAVISAVRLTDAAVESSLTFKPIGNKLISSDSTYKLARGLESCFAAYKSKGVSFNSIEAVTGVMTGIEDVMVADLQSALTVIRTTYNVTKDDTEKSIQDLLDTFGKDLSDTVNSVSVPETDGLFKTVKAFYESVNKLRGEIDDLHTDAYLQRVLDESFANLQSGSVGALSEQAFNRMMDLLVRNKLSEIFGISGKLFPVIDDTLTAPQGGDSSGGDGENNDGQANGGSDGDKDKNFGSNDVIYDYTEGKYVPYGEVLYKYYNEVLQRLSSGEMTPELQQYINDYFDLLFSVLDEKEKEN